MNRQLIASTRPWKYEALKALRYAFCLGLMANWVAVSGASPDPVPRHVSFETHVPYALLVDLTSGDVLFEKAARESITPSSMTKIMTIYMVFEALTQGRLKEKDMLVVSRQAANQRGSRMFLVAGAKVSVADLLRGMIVSSGNDACVVVAEALAGSPQVFAEQMNQRAKKLGAVNTHFVNASGWPDPQHVSTCWDLMKLASATLRDFPHLYAKYYHQKKFTYNAIRQHNRNGLLFKDTGTDGLKTGSTEAGGYGIVASSLKEGRRLILVINGAKDSAQRFEEAQKIMNYGFRAFNIVSPHAQGDKALDVTVVGGVEGKAPIVFGEDVQVSVLRGEAVRLKMRVTQPLKAPLSQGISVGVCEVYTENNEICLKTIPLICGKTISLRPGWLSRVGNWVSGLVWPEKVSETLHNNISSILSKDSESVKESRSKAV